MARRGFLFAGAALVSLAVGWGAGLYVGGAFDRDRSAGSGTAARSAAIEPAADAGGAREPQAPGPVLHRRRPDFSLRDLDGRARGPDEWDGKVLVVNFWATWCAPCREEIPLLIDLGRRRPGVQVVGIAVDTAPPVQAFANEIGIDYPILLDGLEGRTMRRYGNRIGAIPFTVIVGRDGVVAYVRAGVIESDELETVTSALL